MLPESYTGLIRHLSLLYFINCVKELHSCNIMSFKFSWTTAWWKVAPLKAPYNLNKVIGQSLFDNYNVDKKHKNKNSQNESN